MEEKKIQELIGIAQKQRQFSYAPYSRFCVGAALLAGNGAVYTGCNIENGAYSPSNCAERTAIFKAVSEGMKDFRAICIVGGKGCKTPEEFCPPCGVCRQVMLEFCGPDFEIILAVDPEHYKVYTLEKLAPMGFQLRKE